MHRATGIKLDVVLASPYETLGFMERAIDFDIDGLEVPVVSPEDLIILKVLAGRGKDMDDARAVVAQRGDALDLARIRDILGLLEQALTRSDLLREFENIRASLDSEPHAER